MDHTSKQSDNIEVMAQRVVITTPQQLKLFAVDENVETQSEPLSLDDKWKLVEEAVQKVAIILATHETKAEKEWFDKECKKLNLG
jgi:hypothetical protein